MADTEVDSAVAPAADAGSDTVKEKEEKDIVESTKTEEPAKPEIKPEESESKPEPKPELVPVIVLSTLPGAEKSSSQEVEAAVAGKPAEDTKPTVEPPAAKEESVNEDAESEESESDDDDEEAEDEDDDEDEPPQKTVRTPAKTPARKGVPARTPGTATTKLDSTVKKRGRPSRADIQEREKEREAALARGEPDPELKRKRRKPNKLIDAASEEEEEESKTKKSRKIKEESTEESDTEKKPKKKGKGRKVLSAKELEERDKERKRKYHEQKQIAKEKKERREKYLIMKREEKKQQKLEEKQRIIEHDKRMAELRAQYLDDNAMDGIHGSAGGPCTPAEFMMDENSQSSMGSMSASVSKKRKCWGDVGVQEMKGSHNPLAHVTADTLFEYKWPLEGRNSEHYFLQEQVTEYLQVKSFKRKYPDCPRRLVDMEERDFLMEMKIVNEMQADLGLTAIPSSAVLDIMCQDFYDKYEFYMGVLNERKERSLRNCNYSSGGGDVKVEEAAKIAAEYNKQLNLERTRDRSSHFDMQTFTVHYPKTGKGRMKVLARPKLGNYPIGLIPGQFVDSFKSYSSKELKYFPLNTVMVAPPKPGVTLKDLNLGSEGSESDSDSSSSGSSDDSDSESEDEKTTRSGKKLNSVKNETSEMKEEVQVPAPETKPNLVEEVRPNAICKMCQGNVGQNKLGLAEMMLNCTKCAQSCHPTCAGLHLDLLQYVTGYNWECTDCKMCLKCKDPSDEDKMLFCDLCDRGYHIYCVGLQEVPSGRWHCFNCTACISCGATTPFEDGKEDTRYHGWAHETKLNLKGEKIFSHTMCQPCHKTWKKGLYCPECNGVFDRSKKTLSSCWVCTRQYHTTCVGLEKENEKFICGSCQRKVQERTLGSRSNQGGAKNMDTPSRQDKFNSSYSKTPVTSSFSRSGRRVTQINFANQF